LGGDELFGGYPSFKRLARSARFFQAWGHVPRATRTSVAQALRAAGRASVASEKFASMLEGDGSVASLYPLTRCVLSPSQQRGLFERSWLAATESAADPYTPLLEDAFQRHPRLGILTRVSYAEARTYMHDLLLRDTDQMSMAHALEIRVPFLDHELVEYVVGLADARKRGRTSKPLLVAALGGLLPEETVHRAKQGFTLPLGPWMRGPLREFCEQRLGAKRLGGRGIFRPTQLTALWDDFVSCRSSVSWSRLWLLVSLEEWLARHAF
jgi:asparagine synthase (glutamine-hydrolysing)